MRAHAPLRQHAAMDATAGPTRKHRPDAPRPRAAVDGPLQVVLFEDEAGRLLVVDARIGAPGALAVPAVRLGRAALLLRHLGSSTADRLRVDGQAVVDGADAVNVLLAFADALARAGD